MATKLNLYSTSDLKSTLDDHIPVYLSSSNTPSQQPLPRAQRLTPSYTLSYVRLALGYAAVALAGWAFYADYILKQSFAAQKPYLWIAVPVYFVLNSALTLWIWLAEKGCVFQGSRSGLSVRIDSLGAPKKYDPTYVLRVTETQSGKTGVTRTIEAKFMKFFREDGHFAPEAFEEWLRGEIPLLVEGRKTK